MLHENKLKGNKKEEDNLEAGELNKGKKLEEDNRGGLVPFQTGIRKDKRGDTGSGEEEDELEKEKLEEDRLKGEKGR